MKKTEIAKIKPNTKDKSHKIQRMFMNIKAVYSLTMMSFVLNYGAVFFVLIFPFLLVLIIGGVFHSANPTMGQDSATGGIVASGIIIAAVTGNGLNGLSVRLTQWRQSTITKRIGATPLKKWEFLFGALSFYVTVMIFQTLWVISLTFMLQKVIGKIDATGIHPWAIFVSGILTIFFAVSLGILLSSLSRDVNTNSLFGIMIYLPSAFLSGQYIPLQSLDKNGTLKIFSEIWPQRYLIIFMYHGWGVPDLNGISEWTHQAIIIGSIYPFLVSILAIFVASRLFKWE